MNSARSYLAVLLSTILPGLGQFYLNHVVKGTVLLFIFASAAGIFYINSLPVTEWRDLLRFKPAAGPAPPSSHNKTIGETSRLDTVRQEDTHYAFHLWTFDDGEKLFYRPIWKLKISALIQALLCWLYAVRDAWRSQYRHPRKRNLIET